MHGASLLGEVLGNYRLTQELSTGGMGTVYRGVHELLGRTVAIKLLRPELCGNDVLVQRFFNEAKAASAIRHPGIIEVYDLGYTEDGRAYLVMELLAGEELRARIERRKRLSELEAVTVARGIASALEAAHAAGIVHRDLKPDNIFLVPHGEGTGHRVKVLDFGVAKLTDRSGDGPRYTQTGALLGTPLYMAPEQARAAGSIDHRADLYSLGCILYELLVGKPPFLADGAGEIIALQLFGEAEKPSARAPGLSPDVDKVVMKLLEKEPHDRYQSAEEVHEALVSVLGQITGGDPSESRPSMIPPTRDGVGPALRFGVGEAVPEPPLAKKRSALPIIAGVIVVVIAAGATFFAMSRGGDAAKDRRKDPPPSKPVEIAKPTPAPAHAVAPPVVAPAATVAEDPVTAVETPGRRVSAARPKAAGAPSPPAPKPPETTPRSTTGMHTSEGSPIEPGL